MRTEIIFGILVTLINNERVTAKELAQKFEVSERSIYRYLYALDASGVPVVSYHGAGGGYSVLSSYKISAAYFTAQEQDALLESVNTSLIADKLRTSITDKLKALNSCAGEMYDVVRVDTGFSSAQRAKLNVIREAIINGKRLTIVYHAREGESTEREIEPHCIVCRQGSWYLYAFCRLRRTFRMFKLSRILDLETVDKPFKKKPFTIETDYSMEPVESRARFCDILFLCNQNVRYDIEEWAGDGISPCGSQYLVRTIQPYDKYLIKQLVCLGSDIKIISPTEIKKEIINTLNETLDHLQNETDSSCRL